MTTLEGDLLDLALAGRFDVIVHGANCQCTMGAGIAKAIRKQFPEAYEADRATEKGDRSKLGTITSARVVRGSVAFTIINGYTQFHWRGRGVKADYDAIRSVFQHVRRQYAGQRIGYPKIGAGLAGGNWDEIARIIEDELNGEDHTLVVLPS
ncbi:MAG: macro domain-containing protein [Bacteroidota bacterium]